MSNYYSDPHQYLSCKMCKIVKDISYYRFKIFRCRLCVHLYRYRFEHTKHRFKEIAEVYKINGLLPYQNEV